MFTKSIFLQRQYFKDNKIPLSCFVAVGLIKNLAAFLLSVSIGEFFTVHFHSDGSKKKLLKMFGIHLHSLSSFFTLFAALIILKGIFEYLEKYICFNQGEKFVKHIRETIFSAQMGWTSEKFKQKYFGKYLLRYSNDMKAIQNFLTKGVMGGFKDLCFLLMGFILLSMVNGKLALCFMILSVITMLCVYQVSKKQKKLIINSRTKRSGLLSLVAKGFQKHNSLKQNNKETETIQRFDRASAELYHSNMLNNRFESFLESLLAVLQFLIIGIILALMTAHDVITIHKSSALVFVLIMLLLMPPMKRVLKVPSILNKGRVSLEKINELLHNTETFPEAENQLILTDGAHFNTD